jgi:hypothetical protein
MAEFERARGKMSIYSPKGMRPDPEKFAEAHADFVTAKVERWVRETLSASPEIGDERRARLLTELTGLLAPAGDRAAPRPGDH